MDTLKEWNFSQSEETIPETFNILGLIVQKITQ